MSDSQRSIEFSVRERVSSLGGGHLWSPLPVLAWELWHVDITMPSCPLKQEGTGLSPLSQ